MLLLFPHVLFLTRLGSDMYPQCPRKRSHLFVLQTQIFLLVSLFPAVFVLLSFCLFPAPLSSLMLDPESSGDLPSSPYNPSVLGSKGIHWCCPFPLRGGFSPSCLPWDLWVYHFIPGLFRVIFISVLYGFVFSTYVLVVRRRSYFLFITVQYNICCNKFVLNQLRYGVCLLFSIDFILSKLLPFLPV